MVFLDMKSAIDCAGAGLSAGEEPQSPAPKKTRRGKRAGRNQKLRAEQIMQQRLSSESARPSIDLPGVGTSKSLSTSYRLDAFQKASA